MFYLLSTTATAAVANPHNTEAQILSVFFFTSCKLLHSLTSSLFWRRYDLFYCSDLELTELTHYLGITKRKSRNINYTQIAGVSLIRSCLQPNAGRTFQCGNAKV